MKDKLKLSVTVSLVIFLLVIVSVIFVFVFSNSKSSTQIIIQNETKTVTAAEIAKHSTQADCWMSIGGSVYNLTSFVNTHSGCAGAILENCGQDGTISFNTKDRPGGRGHPAKDVQVLNQYLIGQLATSTTK